MTTIYDRDYKVHREIGSSVAIYIVRDIVKNIDTKGMWIDVKKLDADLLKDGRRDGWWDIDSMEVELFPRKKKPKIHKGMDQDQIDYETWKTATEDIAEQRKHGYKGDVWRVCPILIKDRHRTYKTVTKYWNPKFDQYVPKEWGIEGCEVRNVKLPTSPKYTYTIKSLKKIRRGNQEKTQPTRSKSAKPKSSGKNSSKEKHARSPKSSAKSNS